MSAMNKKRTESTETLKKVLRFIGRYRILLVVSIVLAAASVLLQLYVPILFGNAIDQIIAEQKVNFSQMWRWLRQVLLVVLFSGAASWIMNLINNRIAYRTVQDIRAKAIRHIQKLPLSYLDSHSTGDIISRITADADILSDGLLLGFTQLFSGMVTIIGTLVIAVVWGFFEGFNYVVICEKINRRFPVKTKFFDWGALVVSIMGILFHPMSFSIQGIIEIVTTFIAIYGMLQVRKVYKNAWGCVFAFLFIWNAL